MRASLRVLLAVALVGGVSIVPSAGAGPEFKNKYSNESTVTVTCDDSAQADPAGTVTYKGPLKLWPPNHKYATATVTAKDEDSGDNVSLTTEATHDQYDGDTGAETNGSGNTADDITPAAQTTATGTGSAVQSFKIRSERSGRIKEGRTYTISFEAVFSDSDNDNSSEDMSTCTGSFQIVVPHDMRPSNR